MTRELILIICSYLLGSIPTGLLLAKGAGIDIRKAGSGNIGATNVYRTTGKKLGILTLIGDCLKGALPVLTAGWLGMSPEIAAAAGLIAFLGHLYPVFLGFKGGKGVATALGVFLAVSPVAVLAALAVFVIVLMKWRYVSLGSITAAAIMPLCSALLRDPRMVTLLTLPVAMLVIWKHRENIARLRAGTESRFK